MQTQAMTTIAPRSIELGPMPFNIYLSDHSGRLLLFCRAGLEITKKHLEILHNSDRKFFVNNADFDTYMEYSLDRIQHIVNDNSISTSEKAHIIRSVGQRVVSSMIRDPDSGESLARCGDYTESLVTLVLRSPQSFDSLFSISMSESYLLAHSVNVSTFCILIGTEIYGKHTNVLWQLGMGGLLHDVGMSRIASEVYKKAGPLTPEERETVRRHPLVALEMLTPFGLPGPVLDMISQHHERCDGSGYPYRLTLNETHHYARIAAVADIYDAVTSKRSYCDGKKHFDALVEISGMAEKIDPTAFEALFHIVLRDSRLIARFRKENLS